MRCRAVLAMVSVLAPGCALEPEDEHGEITAASIVRAPVIGGELTAGFAVVDVTPTRVLPMGGYGVWIWPATPRTSGEGVHDRLQAGAVALRRVDGEGDGLVLVTVDAVGLSSAVIGRVRERVQSARGSEFAVLVSATHSHSTPDTMGLWGALPCTGRDRAYMRSLERSVARAAIEAIDALVPATLAVASGRHANSTSGGDGPVDDGFVTVLATDQGGALLGSFTQWSAHPTVLGQDNNAISADYVAAFRHFLGQRWPGASHLFFSGTLGGVYTAPGDELAPDPFGDGDRDVHALRDYERMARRGRDLAESVAAAVSEPLAGPLVVRRAQVAIRNENPLFRIALELGVIESIADGRGVVRPELVQVELGPLAIATAPGEIFPGGALALKELLGRRGARHRMVIGMAQEWLGYLMSPEDCAAPGNDYFETLSVSCRSVPALLAAHRALLGGRERADRAHP